MNYDEIDQYVERFYSERREAAPPDESQNEWRDTGAGWEALVYIVIIVLMLWAVLK